MQRISKFLFMIHSGLAIALCMSTILACVLATINFDTAMDVFHYAWLPSLPGIFLALLIAILSYFRFRVGFVLGILSCLLTLPTFKKFMYIKTWQISIDPHSFATISFNAQVTSVLNLFFLIVSFIGLFFLFTGKNDNNRGNKP